MAAYVQFFLKGTDKSPTMAKLDDNICVYFGVEPDAVKYFARWYDIIAFSLAMGKSFAWIKEQLIEDRAWTLYGIACYLEEFYSTEAWYGR